MGAAEEVAVRVRQLAVKVKRPAPAKPACVRHPREDFFLGRSLFGPRAGSEWVSLLFLSGELAHAPEKHAHPASHKEKEDAQSNRCTPHVRRPQTIHLAFFPSALKLPRRTLATPFAVRNTIVLRMQIVNGTSIAPAKSLSRRWHSGKSMDADSALKGVLRNCAVPTGLGSNSPLDPALRLRLRAGLSSSVPAALGFHA